MSKKTKDEVEVKAAPIPNSAGRETEKTKIVIERQVGGFDIFCEISEAPAYRRFQERIETEVDQFLRPYKEEGRSMHRTDASRVCSALSEKIRAFGITFTTPFSIRPDAPAAKSSQPSHAA